MELSMHIKQNLSLSPQLLQSMRVLQMSDGELADFIENCTQENPMLEAGSLSSHTAAAMPYEISTESQGETLRSHLLTQLRLSGVKGDRAAICAYLIDSLDENGYLEESAQAVAVQVHRELQDVLSALELLQSFEPAGVGAGDASECLLLQLCRIPDTHLAQMIVKKHLKNLSLERYSLIAKAEQTDVARVRAAAEIIRGLSPRPGCSFAGAKVTEFVYPELSVTINEGKAVLSAVHGISPTVCVSSYYLELMDKSQDIEVISYLKERLSQAEEIVRSIEQRRATLFAVGEEILRRQEMFFLHGDVLRPMTQQQIADSLGVHKSTVSRAIRGKYIMCEHGIYPLHSFFCRAIRSAEAEVSPDKAKKAIRELIDAEDPARPMSDQKIAAALNALGIPISRRTVAKYRDAMHILSATYRKH